MNILVTSAGRRVKIIEYFKETLAKVNGKVIATDCDENAPAIYFADDYEIVPRIDDPHYIRNLIDISKKHKIEAIISLIDPELELLANHQSLFEQNNITLILSPSKYVDISFDKYETYAYLNKKGINSVPTYRDLDKVKKLLKNEEITYPLVVKPAKGSASLGLFIVENENELIEAYHKFDGQIIQPFYKDKEFGIDVYIDLNSGELVDIFIKEKLRMRAGETDKSKSIHNDKIETLVKSMIEKTGFRGPIDIDCFEYNGEYYISEINPRFGGGYPHAYELGCDFIEYILQNLQGHNINPYKGYGYKKDYIMMKYDYVEIMPQK